MRRQYERIIFMQGEDATEPLEILEEDGAMAALEYLAQWDTGDAEVTEVRPWGQSDAVRRMQDGYILTFNRRIGYIGLCREIDNEN